MDGVCDVMLRIKHRLMELFNSSKVIRRIFVQGSNKKRFVRKDSSSVNVDNKSCLVKKSAPKIGLSTAAIRKGCLGLKEPICTVVMVVPNVCTGWTPIPKIVSTLSLWSGGLRCCGRTLIEMTLVTDAEKL